MKIVRNIIIGVVLIAFFAFAITMTVLMLNVNKYGVTEFEKSVILIIKDKVALEQYKENSVVVVKKLELDQVKTGDEVFVYKVRTDGGVNIEVGIVGEVHLEDEAITYENGATYGRKFIIGTADKIHENYGKYLGVIMSKWGFLFIVLVPSFLIFVYELYALVIEVKYGKDEV